MGCMGGEDPSYYLTGALGSAREPPDRPRCTGYESIAVVGDLPGTTDDDLVERARRGSAAAYDELVLRYTDMAFRTAYLVTGSAADAEEVAQDAFVKAHRALSRFRAGAAFRPWLLSIVGGERGARRGGPLAGGGGRGRRAAARAPRGAGPAARRPAPRRDLPLPAAAVRRGDRRRARDPRGHR